MRKHIIVLICAVTFMLACIAICGIFNAAMQKPVSLTPMHDAYADSQGHKYVHAGDHFLWTVDE